MTALLLAAMGSLYVVLASNTSCWTITSVTLLTQETHTENKHLVPLPQPPLSHLTHGHCSTTLPKHWLATPSDDATMPLVSHTHQHLLRCSPGHLSEATGQGRWCQSTQAMASANSSRPLGSR